MTANATRDIRQPSIIPQFSNSVAHFDRPLSQTQFDDPIVRPRQLQPSGGLLDPTIADPIVGNLGFPHTLDSALQEAAAAPNPDDDDSDPPTDSDDDNSKNIGQVIISTKGFYCAFAIVLCHR